VSETGEKREKKKRAWKSRELPRVFTVRANEDEYNRLKVLAKKSGLSLSRLVIEGTLENGVKDLNIRDVEASMRESESWIIETFIFELRRIGVNLNQLAHAQNAYHRGGGQSPTAAEIERVLAEMEKLIGQAKKKL
jgi:RPA family protein